MKIQIAIAGMEATAATAEAAGRTQKWFDGLKKTEQKKYLEKHPNSKFGKGAAKPAGKKTAAKPAATKKGVGEHEQKVRDRKAAMRDRIKALRAMPKTESRQKKINGLVFDLKRMGGALQKAVNKDRAAAQKSKAAADPTALIKKIERIRDALVMNRADIIGDRWGKKRDALNRKRHNLQLDLKEALKAAKAAKVKVPKDTTVRKPIRQKPDRHDEW